MSSLGWRLSVCDGMMATMLTAWPTTSRAHHRAQPVHWHRAHNCCGGNRAAGTRVRKIMQDVKNLAQEIRKEMLGSRED